VLAGELAREIVERAEPLDADEERFVRGETGCLEPADLSAQVVFELVDVAAVDRFAP
jgi:hypothetical protein